MEGIFNFLSRTNFSDIGDVFIDVILTAVVAELVYLVFVYFGNTFSNRKLYGKIFLPVAVCTTLVIVLIKSSLALSLGLVGVLSIVRFRAAVKEPEELAYTFLAVAIGLGFGTGERVLTLAASGLILVLLIIRGLYNKKSFKKDTYNFSVITSAMDIDSVMSVLGKHTSAAMLRRCDNNGSQLSAQFNIEFSTASQLQEAISDLKTKDPDIMTSFVANSTLM